MDTMLKPVMWQSGKFWVGIRNYKGELWIRREESEYTLETLLVNGAYNITTALTLTENTTDKELMSPSADLIFLGSTDDRENWLKLLERIIKVFPRTKG